ncbi:MAG: MFS transporter [Paracoccaceae bacterium]
MATLLVAGFMNLIDVTIVNVALPSLRSDFGASANQIEWVAAIYILVFALVLVPGGRYGDLLGRRRVFLWGVCVFTLGSALCGMAPSISTLLAARVLQAVGAALMTPQTMAIVPAIFPPEERGAAFAAFGFAAGLASVAGPLLGGLLIQLDLFGLDWRPIFLVNVPVGLLAVVLALRFVPRVGGRADARNDFVGIALAALTLFLVIFPLIDGRQIGWPWWCYAAMASALPLAGVFVWWQKRQAARGAPQLLPAELLGSRNFLVGIAVGTLLFSGMPGFFFLMALFLQEGYGLTALQSGLTTIPFPVGVLLASIIAGRLGNRWMRRRISIGGGMMALAMLMLSFLVRHLGGVLERLELIAPLLLGGLGLGTAVSPLFNTILSNVNVSDTGSASGVLQAFQRLGGALGIAIVGWVFFTLLGGQDAARTAYDRAFSTAILYNVTVFCIISGLIWLLPRPKGQEVGAEHERCESSPKPAAAE